MIDVPTRVKDALRENNLLKNYRFNVLNDDDTVDFTIDNNNLKSEKVCFDERLASGDVLKFGLCEGTSLEFQYFGLPDINGRRIQAFIDVQYKDAEGQKQWYTIPMGFYTVKKCPMQFSTGIRKVTAYNKLMSDYLDEKANNLILDSLHDKSLPISIYDIQKMLLNNYQIIPVQKETIKTANRLKSDGFEYLSTKLTSQNTNSTPINSANLFRSTGNAWNTTFYLMPSANGWSYVTDPTKFYTINTDYDLASWESDFVDYVSNLINDSELTVNATTFLNWVANSSNGWRHMMAIEIIYSDNTSKIYSDAAFLRNKANGTFADIIGKTITNAIEVVLWQGCSLSECTDTTSGNIYNMQYYDGADYKYFYSYGDERYYPTFKFPNGEDMPEYGRHGHVDPVPYWFHCYEITGISEAEKIMVNPSQLSDFTLREIIGADYELSCQFGKLDRETDLFSGVELNNPTLYPQDTLYPEDTLYPSGTKERTIKSSYSQLWTDDGGEQSFKYLIITYQGLDENNQKVDFTLQRTINTHGTTNYNLSDNWLFKNLIWTAEQVGAYADAMVEKMRNIRWFPFEMWASGLPYLETGDEIEIVDRQGQTHTSYVLKRTLEGIQNLQDTYENGIVDVF